MELFQNDWALLRATVVTWGWNRDGTGTKIRVRKLTQEKKIHQLLPLGLKPMTFWWEFGALMLSSHCLAWLTGHLKQICLQGPGPQQVEVITDVNDIKEPDDRSSLSSSFSSSSSSSSYSNKKTDEMTGLFNLVGWFNCWFKHSIVHKRLKL